jgi:hypothetical protein
MAEVVQFPLGEALFFIEKYPPFLAGRNLITLQRLLITPALKGINPVAAMEQEGLIAALGGITGLLESMTEDRFDQLRKMLIDDRYVRVSIRENEPVKLTEGNFNLTGLGVADLIELMAAVVRVNYEDFGRRAVILFGEARAKAQSLIPASSAKVPNSP